MLTPLLALAGGECKRQLRPGRLPRPGMPPPPPRYAASPAPVCRLPALALDPPAPRALSPCPASCIRVFATVASTRIMTAPMTARPLLLQQQRRRHHERRHVAPGPDRGPRRARTTALAAPRPLHAQLPDHHAAPRPPRDTQTTTGHPRTGLSTPPRHFVSPSTGSGSSAHSAVCAGRLAMWISMTQRDGCCATSSACSPGCN